MPPIVRQILALWSAAISFTFRLRFGKKLVPPAWYAALYTYF